MKIAVLSGKGGTGKTFVSVNLATSYKSCTYIDCDVEEPNGRLFLKPENTQNYIVNTKIPFFDNNRCTQCKKCVEFCRFNALVMIKGKVKVFSDICHACGGCVLVCKEKAIIEQDRSVGNIEIGIYKNTKVITGILNLGEASAVPVISKALSLIKNQDTLSVIDCPPGSSCSVMASIKSADYCLFVAESTAFGLHNLCMVYELCSIMGKPCGVILNKFEYEYKPIEDFFTENNIPVIARIPYSEEISKTISAGLILSENDKKYKELFQSIIKKISGELK